MKISIAGTGYVGLVTAVCLAEKGHRVTCVDVDREKIRALQKGKAPIYEHGLEERMHKHKERIAYTSDYAEAYKHADAIFIGVGTPEKKDGSANLDYVCTVARQIAQTAENDCVVVVKSTVPVGTADKIEQIIKGGKKQGIHIEVVSNPEFLSQGTAIRDTLNAARIVLGVQSAHAESFMKDLYDDCNIPYVVTDRKSAEMIKYAANDFLALKLSYINEIANVCELVGANIDDVAKGMGMDPRIGGLFLQAGIGYGGSCFPKDTKALHWLASFYDYEIKTIKAAIEVNERQKIKLIQKARAYYESFHGLVIAVLGLTYKPGTDDLREAPSLDNIPILLEEGAALKVWDPVGMDQFRKRYPDELAYCDSIEEALTDADLCFILTDWPEIKRFDPSAYARLMRKPIVLDGRNCYRLDRVTNKGILYASIGRETVADLEGAFHGHSPCNTCY